MSESTSFVGRIRASQKSQRRLGMIVRYLLAVVLITFALFPVVWVVSASLNPSGGLATQSLIPPNASLENYQTLLADDEFTAVFPFTTWLLNSLKIASFTTIFSVSITTLAAYSFSRFRFYQRQNMLRGLLLIQVFPSLLAMVAVFLLIQQIGDVIPAIGLDTHAGLILVYLGGAMGINIWLTKGFFRLDPAGY